ncbi:MAG: cell division protein FtsL [Lachnospiraceae bacterium]|nr:cell division protein FtsL [Lachnospiraceae bacterium]
MTERTNSVRTNTARTNSNRSYASGRRNTPYAFGNTAEDLFRELDSEPRKKISNNVRRNRERALHMDLPQVLFFVVALCISAIILVNYIRVQSKVTASVETISKLESEYLDKKTDNEEEYSRIVSSVDMDEIKRVAIEELGMHYAKEGQIVTYADEKSDYVRQYSDID